MSLAGGVFSRLYSWVTDRDNAVKIRADRMDAEFDGIATALSTAMYKDGQQTITANIPMNSKKLTGLAAGTGAGDSLRYEQIVGGSLAATFGTLSAAATTLTSSSTALTLKSSDPGATGVISVWFHDSASPAVSDIIAFKQDYGRDSATNQEVYFQEYTTITDPTSTTEDASHTWQNVVAGTLKTQLELISTGVRVTNLLDISPATGGQIKFPASQNASADANTFDDYEEGTYTPAIVGLTTAGAGTYSTQVGEYTKIGNRVLTTWHLIWSAHTGTGNMSVSIPFAAGADAVASLLPSNLTAANPLYGAISVGAGVLLYTAASGAALTGLAMDTAASLDGAVVYRV